MLYFNPYFRVTFVEFLHNFEGSDNTMNLRILAAFTLSPNGDVQGGTRCFSLASEKC